MRRRILVNRVKRTSKLANTLFGLLVLLGVCVSLGSFALALILGINALPGADPVDLMLVWIVLTIAFVFFWAIGLMTDLQRSDAMSFRNLLHLPVSLGWVFLYNYLSSFVSISAAIFLPGMVGLCLAMVIVYGPPMLLSLALVLGMFGMVTALTYQLRGWLARMMENKRRGRNIVAAITVTFVVLLQVPNLIHLSVSSSRRAERERVEAEHAESEPGTEDTEVSPEERLAVLRAEQDSEKAEVDRIASLCAAIIPVGWLPYGVRSAFDGHWIRSLLCLAGMLIVAALSLRRSYRKTLASLTSGGDGGDGGAVALPSPAPRTELVRKPLMVERHLPFAGERETGIAFASLRSLLRAPEARMILLSPIIIFALFGIMLAKNPALDSMKNFAPLLSLGATAMGLLSISQLLQNQFGLDRRGFRAYVLSPVPRHLILIGKNLGTAPLGLGIGLLALVGLQFFVPLDVSHFLGACLQLLSAYMLLCLVGNTFSILAPLRLKEHGVKAANVKMKTIVQQVFSVFLIPIVLSPLLIPYGVEFLVSGESWARGVPVYLILHGLELIVVFLLYSWLIRRQGELFQSDEQQILETLTRE